MTDAAERCRMLQLIAAGFTTVGHWQLDEADCGPRFIGQVPVDPGVYAFVVDGDVCYIGSAQRGLSRRLRKYANLNNKGPVATRIRLCIIDALKSGSEVIVLTTGCGPLFWKGLPIDLIAGLEEGLIRALQPAWNVRGLRGLRKDAAIPRVPKGVRRQLKP